MQSYQRVCVAAGIVTGATGVGTSLRGCTTGRNGAGDYTITLPANEGVDATECQIEICARSAAGIYRVVHTSDVAKQILSFSNAGVALDMNFDFAIWQYAWGDT